LGCIAAGTAGVPVYPPDPRKLDQSLLPLRSIVPDAEPSVVITDALLSGLRERMSYEIPALRDIPWIETDPNAEAAPDGDWRRPALDERSLAFLQYTSGSTSAPKGVMVTHGNLLANLRQQAAWLDVGDDMRMWIGERFRSSCWLPFYHDMGLISGILLTMYTGGETTFISPIDFARRPLLWLEAISRYEANFGGGPDFAYALCVRRSTREQREVFDLSSWRCAFTGAEPVRSRTLDSFASAFARAGFRPDAFAPCYGLAEATLLVTMRPRSTGAKVGEFDTGSLEAGRAVRATPGSARVSALASCGPPVRDVEVLVVDPASRQPLAEGRVGEVWIRGANVAAGYWRAPEMSRSCFDQALATGETGFLRTGDLGFLLDGELYVTGRLKDLIIVHGRNHSPAAIEQTVEYSHRAIRRGASAAFAVDGDKGEELVVVAEAAHNDEEDRFGLFEVVAAAVSERHGIALAELVLISPRTIPRTSSGKIQRAATRSAYLSGGLSVETSVTPRQAAHAPPPEAR
jgi:acyl-CoA synthetase (AMP-forming)/AMP-acid ligase II